MLSIGIVGLPNVGKSTLFKALTKKAIDISNYPFTTIDPNVGVVAVPDERLQKLADLSHSKKIIPTAIEFIDIAGLIKGAAEGEGLGNKFLANIREVDAIAHVVRVFESKEITHVHNKIDPINDIGIIKTELELADLQSQEKRAARKNKDEELPELNLLAQKKVIYVLNASEEQVKNHWQPSPELLQAMGNSEYVVLCANFELLLSESSTEEQVVYMADLRQVQSGLDDLIKHSYHLLGLLTFLTTGEDETRAWTAHQGDLIPKASSAIHTDFEHLFIRAEAINWQTLLSVGGWGKARESGALKLVGKDYAIQEGDVVEIKI
ncbi:MAG: GTP-binding protein YchF [Microgenomates group bacterium GW2011_GWA1_Microgenomates_45_10]|nr:MAG: GTP-binding protein YchF [Microgenomates group bacterium GW2011_GWA1_Microgenomates_45_10]